MASYTAKIIRHYGPVSVEFEVSNTVDTSDAHKLVHRMLGATNFIMDAHAEFASTQLHKMDISHSAETQSSGTVELPVNKITKTIDKGTKMIRVHGGNWNKFGVPIYPDVFNAIDWMADFVRDAEQFELVRPNLEFIAQVEDGKPKRVLAIREISQ